VEYGSNIDTTLVGSGFPSEGAYGPECDNWNGLYSIAVCVERVSDVGMISRRCVVEFFSKIKLFVVHLRRDMVSVKVRAAATSVFLVRTC
jgi:hypothetical protein